MTDQDESAGTTYTVSGGDETVVVLAGLTEVLRAARGDESSPGAAVDTTAVPIRGQGATLGAVFAELARDLLAQLDVQGGGLTHVRLDGLLRGDDGYVGWGYLEGTAAGGDTAAGIDLDGEPTIARDDTGITISFDLRPIDAT